MRMSFAGSRWGVLMGLVLSLVWSGAGAVDADAAQAQKRPKQSESSEKSTHSPSTKTKTKATQPPSAKVKFLPSSEETVAQRRTRLKAECKGRVDAGACTGLTR